jgi:hypothetical protein
MGCGCVGLKVVGARARQGGAGRVQGSPCAPSRPLSVKYMSPVAVKSKPTDMRTPAATWTGVPV